MKVFWLLFYLGALAFSFSCQKDKMSGLSIDRYNAILDSTILKCEGEQSAWHLNVTIDGKEICYFDGFEGYMINALPITYFSSYGTGTAINPGDSSNNVNSGNSLRFQADHPINNYTEIFYINSPRWNGIHEFKELVERFLVKGEYPVAGIGQLDTTAFNIGFFTIYDYKVKQPGVALFHYIDIASIYGDQNSDSYFKITKTGKSIQWGRLTYNVEIEFQCQLYSAPNSPVSNKHWGNLTDGKMALQIILDE